MSFSVTAALKPTASYASAPPINAASPASSAFSSILLQLHPLEGHSGYPLLPWVAARLGSPNRPVCDRLLFCVI